MKKKFLKVVLVILILFILIKSYHLIIIKNSYNAIKKFRNEENRYYTVSTIISKSIVRKEEIFVDRNIIKYVKKNDTSGTYCEWKNLQTDEKYAYNMTSKSLYNDKALIERTDFLTNLPNLITSIYKNGKFNIVQALKVQYIIPTKYDNKSCYKISTKTEIVIIEKDTYLPVYSTMKTVNSEAGNGNKTENTYEFKVGTVTEEDIELPDFSDYESYSGN